MKITYNLLKQLPKTDLHCHMEGSLRINTIIELARRYDITLPSYDEKKLGNILKAGDKCKSLVEYLKPFSIAQSVIQDYDAIKRAAFELAEDAYSENVLYMEVRFSPFRHINKGLSMEEVLSAALKGLKKAEKKYGIKTGVIVCGIRQLDSRIVSEIARAAVKFKNKGVVAFDLAGAEKNYPAKYFTDAFNIILNNNLNSTVHAGEADGPESIKQALTYCGAQRIGHGIRLIEDRNLFNYVKDRRIPLEICISSNVQTKTVKSYKLHPFKKYFDSGIRVTLNTDNRMVSDTSSTGEYYKAVKSFNLNKKDIANIIINGFKSAFLSYDEKSDLLRKVILDIDRKLGLNHSKDTYKY